MKPLDKRSQQPQSLQDRIAAVLDREIAVSPQSDLDRFLTTALLKSLSSVIERDGEDQRDALASAKAVARQYIEGIERWSIVLPKVLEQIEAWETSYARRMRYSQSWWEKTYQTLYTVFQETPQAGVDRWLQTYADALVAWELDICDKLTREEFPFPPHLLYLQPLFQSSTQAIRDKEYQTALGMLPYLTQPLGERPQTVVLDESTRASLLVFMGRIQMQGGDDTAALERFQLAREIAPQDGRPLAALGRYYQLREDFDRAMALHRQAVSLSPDQPDGNVGMGLLLEAQNWWDQAEVWYERAVVCALKQKDSDAALCKMLAPVSGNLYLELARALEPQAPELALSAVTRAQELGIKGDGSYPERIGYELKGRILEKLSRDEEAAVAYYEAGRRYGWRNEYEKAVSLLEQAKELNEKHVSTYWFLADDLRMLSGDETRDRKERNDLIEKSLDVWERGASLLVPPTPSVQDSWTFLTRALLNESLLDIRDITPKDLPKYRWQAIVYIERAVLLKRDEAFRWAHLGRYYYSLNKESNTRLAILTALKHDANNLAAREGWLIYLTNSGRSDEAMDFVNEWLKDDDSHVWARLVKANLLTRQKCWEEALELSSGDKGKHYWAYSSRAHCYVMLGQPDEALKEYLVVWEHYRANDFDNLNSFGWAALNIAMLDKKRTGLLDKAINIFKRVIRKRDDEFAPYINLGCCYLAKEETLNLAQGMLERGLALTKNIRELNDVVDSDFTIIEYYARKWSHTDKVKQILEGLEEIISQQREKIAQQSSLSSEDELIQEIELLKEKGQTDGFAWWGAHAGLARIYLEEKQWPAAAEVYSQLTTRTDVIPEARIGLEKATDELHAEAIQSIEAGQVPDALVLFQRTLRAEEVLSRTDKVAELHSQLGYTQFVQADRDAAREHFGSALQLYRELGKPNPGDALSTVCQSLLTDIVQYWALDDELAAFAESESVSDALRADIDATRESLAGYLDNSYQLPEDTNAFPLVTPIAVEFASNLIQEGANSEWPFLKEHIPYIRRQIQREMGVEIPGVRVRRGGQYLAPDLYLILINETPVAMGSVEPNTDPLVSVTLHLQAVLRRNLANFVGVQKVEDMLGEWEQSEEGMVLVSKALPDQVARLRFARLLRALVQESVPITRWEEILETVQEIDWSREGMDGALGAVRLCLKEDLPGNQGGSTHIDLPSEIEAQIASCIQHKDGKMFLAVPPAQAAGLYAKIRELVNVPQSDLVLVTSNIKVRPFVRRFVEREFPSLTVLARQEVLSSDEMRRDVR